MHVGRAAGDDVSVKTCLWPHFFFCSLPNVTSGVTLRSGAFGNTGETGRGLTRP